MVRGTPSTDTSIMLRRLLKNTVLFYPVPNI